MIMQFLSLSLLSVLVLCGMPQGARSQSPWNVLVTSTSDQQSYYFYGLSCHGSHCTVCGLHQDDMNAAEWVTFFRSDDGGQHWIEQNPKLSTARIPSKFLYVVDQIDSLNVVAGGDSGLVAITADAGKTWGSMQNTIHGKVKDVSFSDPKNGMICVQDSISLYLTSDGGSSWKPAPFHAGLLWQGHAYGHGMFRAFKYGWGPIYSTKDNWVTVDSTTVIFDHLRADKTGELLAFCRFGFADNMIATGIKRPMSGINSGLIYVSNDGGITWTESTLPSLAIGPIYVVSNPDRDTIFAAGDKLEKSVNLVSTDHGSTWLTDSLQFDTAYKSITSRGIELTVSNHLVGIFTSNPTLGQAIIAYRSMAHKSVETYERIVYGTRIYPNPAQNFVSIVSNDPLREVRLIDVLGRSRLEAQLPADGTLKLDISHLGSGIYSVQIDHDGVMIPVGKIAAIGH
jgi:photosystem II stability/assembly factor-like uncharacterized protein